MEVNGTCITHFNGNEIDLSKWNRYRPCAKPFAISGTPQVPEKSYR